MTNLFKSTVAYRIIAGDKKRGELSHAYSLVCEDEHAINGYLRVMAKLLLCDDDEYCDNCRMCRLIQKNAHSDVTFYPREAGGKILSGDIDEIIGQTYIKPIESDKRVFVLSSASSMNASAQNKLLKTLEEPPRGVHIILGVENENALLPTVKSRVKRLEVPLFSEQAIIDGLKASCPDGQRLARAAALCDGKPGLALEYYEQDMDGDTEQLVFTMLEQMKSSREVSSFSAKIDKGNVKQFLICLKKTMSRIMRYQQGQEPEDGQIAALSQTYKTATAIAVIAKINQAEKALYFNGNVTMIADAILLSILEEKYRWQKL